METVPGLFLSCTRGKQQGLFSGRFVLNMCRSRSFKGQIACEGSEDKLHRQLFFFHARDSAVSLLETSYLKPLTDIQTLWLLNAALSSAARGHAVVTSTLIWWHAALNLCWLILQWKRLLGGTSCFIELKGVFPQYAWCVIGIMVSKAWKLFWQVTVDLGNIHTDIDDNSDIFKKKWHWYHVNRF